MTILPNRHSRREVLRTGGSAIAGLSMASVGLPHLLRAAAPRAQRSQLQTIHVGLVADVHQDVIHDAYERMRLFVDQMNQRQVDACIQMGDFAVPHARNQMFLDVWNQFEGPKFHVLGNHDTDAGFTKKQTMKWWGMPRRFYSFDLGGWHFVVLDGNDENPGPWNGYVRYVAEEQRDWLAQDLAETDAPTIVLSHQKLESNGGVANSGEVRAILEQANRAAGWCKVTSCFCGHHHTDGMTEIEGIRYIHVNSMSYKWVGGGNQRKRFADHIEHAHPWVSHTIPYRDPLFTMLTLDPISGTMTIEGKQTEFIPPTPQEMNLPNADQMLPVITARELEILG